MARTRQSLVSLGSAVVVLLVGAQVAHAACDTNWLTAVDGDWDDATKWSNGVPTAADDACITVDGTYTVRVPGSAGSQAANAVTLGGASGTQTLQVEGTFSSVPENAVLAINADSAVGDHGALVLTASGSNPGSAEVQVNAGTLSSSGVIQTLVGSGNNGRIFFGAFKNLPAGTVQIDTDASDIPGSPGGIWTNNGTFNLPSFISFSLLGSGPQFTQAGGALNIGGTLTNLNGATMQTGGVTTVLGDGTWFQNGDVALTGGVLQGNGVVQAAVISNQGATVHPGTSPGTLQINGDYSQGSGGTLAVDVQGPTPGTGYSRLQVDGTATLDGTLHVTTTPIQTGSFDILSAMTAVNGVFSTPVFVGQEHSIAYGSNTVTLTAIPPAPAGGPGGGTETPPGPGPGPGPAPQSLPPPLPIPVALRTGNLEPISGEVLVRLPGSNARVRIETLTSIPVGTLIDATHGVVRLTVAKDLRGDLQSGLFSRGTFFFDQHVERLRVLGKRDKKFRELVTELKMAGGGSWKTCPKGSPGRRKPGPRHGSESRRRFARYLQAKASGHFKVIGRQSAGLERGTDWLTRDDCRGTLTRVKSGSVIVTDFAKDKDLLIKGGESYLATGQP